MAAHDYDTQAFLSIFPESLQEALERLDRFDELVEVVLDLGRVPEARFEFDFVPLSESTVAKGDIDFIVRKVGEFDRDNRGGIEQTLHRISVIRNRHNDVVGLTCRVGRALYGLSLIHISEPTRLGMISYAVFCLKKKKKKKH